MKRYLLLLLSLLTIAIGAKADVMLSTDNFPDPIFRNYLVSQEYGKDGRITDSEMANITALSVPAMGIQTLRGIKYFTALKALFIYRNKIDEYEMEQLVRELPVQSGATLYAYYFGASDENNYMSTLQLQTAQAKGWNVLMWQNMGNGEYLMSMMPFSSMILATYITPEYFPDENFRSALKEQGIGNYYIQDLPYLTLRDVDNAKTLELGERGIMSLKGLEYFTALRTLICPNNQLTTLDVSRNTELIRIDCSRNQLSTLDVSKNTKLFVLNCKWNGLTSLDVKTNTELIELDCQYNQLAVLDVSKNKELTSLYCYDNLLTGLDVSNNKKLKKLYCLENQIRGSEMDNLIASLPENETDEVYWFVVVSNGPTWERNVCTRQQVQNARNRGWTPYYYDYTDYNYKPYDGLKPKVGDVNADGTVDVADIATIIDVMAGRAPEYKAAADVNGDTKVDVADVATIIDVMAGKYISNQAYTCPDDLHPHWIDLGLPSGTKWRCCNVGASSPEEYGGYYTFEEAQAYNPPSHDLFVELLDNCSSKPTTQNGMNGMKFTGPNGASIFFTAAGYDWNGDLGNFGFYAVGEVGFYWSSTPANEINGYCLHFYVESGSMGMSSLSLTRKRPVRLAQ